MKEGQVSLILTVVLITIELKKIMTRITLKLENKTIQKQTNEQTNKPTTRWSFNYNLSLYEMRIICCIKVGLIVFYFIIVFG